MLVCGSFVHDTLTVQLVHNGGTTFRILGIERDEACIGFDTFILGGQQESDDNVRYCRDADTIVTTQTGASRLTKKFELSNEHGHQLGSITSGGLEKV